jgi:hypothetical protein
VTKLTLNRMTRTLIPKRAGDVSNNDHITGFNPRRGKLTSMPGTNAVHMPGQLGGMKVKAKRRSGGFGQHEAPYKHDTSEGNFGFIGPGTGEPV